MLTWHKLSHFSWIPDGYGLMDSLFENIELYCSILRKCSLSEVGKWQEDDLDRAFHWADYFDKALVRISKRKSVIAKVEGKLRELSHSKGWRLGERELNFESFQQSSQYLTKALINNTHLSGKLREKVKTRIKDQAGLDPPAQKREKSESSLPQSERPPIDRKVLPHQPHTPQVPLPLPSDPLSLLKSIHSAQLKGTSGSTHSFLAVGERLNMLFNTSGALDVILHSLVENLPTGSSYESTQKVILHWLVDKMRHSDSFLIWQQSANLLADISSRYLDFFREHLRYLTTEMEKLETISPDRDLKLKDVLDSDRQKSLQDIASVANSNQADSLDKVLSHFVALSRTSKDVREVCHLFVKGKALRHIPRGRFSYSSPLTTCLWCKLLTRINET